MTPRVHDSVFHQFAQEQWRLAQDVNLRSDIARLEPLGGSPPTSYLLVLDCFGLVKRNGQIMRGGPFATEIHFAPDYLRSVQHGGQVLRWVHPQDVFNPNIGRGRNADGPVMICTGKIKPATSIVDLTMQVFEIVSWNKVTIREDDSLALEPCQWGRCHPTAYPVDTRPLYRRVTAVQVEHLPDGAGAPA